MALMPFIFGAGTGIRTPQEAARLRAVAEALASQGRAPHTIGEGLSAIGDAIASRRYRMRADRAETEGRAAYDAKYGDLVKSLISGGGATEPVPTAPGGEYLTGGGIPPPPTMENVANTQLAGTDLPPESDVSISSYSPPNDPAAAAGQPDIQTAGLSITVDPQSAQQPGVTQVADSGSGFDPRMIDALNDPWAPEGTKAVLGAILEQRMKEMGPHDPIKVGEGDTLLDPVTHQPIYSGRQKQTPDEQNFATDRASGYTGSFHQWLTDRYGHPMVSIGPQGEQLPPPPSGFAYVHGPDGKVLFDDRGVPQILPMQGTKEYRDAHKAEESAASGKAQSEQTAGFVGQEVDRAITQIKAAPEWTTGLGGQLLAGVGGTAANNVYELIRPIKSNISIDKLQQMRASSPTGAALGSVTTYEEEMLASAYGSLAMSQDADQLLYNLRRLKAIYGKVINEGIKPGDPIPTGDDTGEDSVPVGTTTDDPSQFKEGSTVKGEDGKTYIIQGGKPVPVL